MFTLSQSDKDRFFSKVEKGDGCWLWKGAKRGGAGYGVFTLRGVQFSAHRVSFGIANPEHAEAMLTKMPRGVHAGYVLHSCDNPPCVNPDHLRLGCATDNARDRVDRNRATKVLTMERWDQTSLTPEIVDDLRRACADGDEDRFWFLRYQHRLTDAVANNIALGRSFRWYQTEGLEFKDGWQASAPSPDQ